MNTLIIRPGAMGDTLMALPGLVDLAGKVDVIFAGRHPGLYFVRDFVHRALDLESTGWHRLFMETQDGRGLPVSKTDLAVAFFRDEDGRIRKNLKIFFPHVPVYVFHSFPPEGEEIHVARYIAGCLKSAGLPVDPERALEKALAGVIFGDTYRSIDRDRILFHPGSGDPQKNHPPDFWLRLIERLGRESAYKGLRKTILLGPAEEHLCPFFKKDRENAGAKIIFYPDKEALMDLLRESAVYIGHDSGITHLSAMSGVPTIALFKGTDIRQWKPPGPRVKVMENRNAGTHLIERILEASKAIITA